MRKKEKLKEIKVKKLAKNSKCICKRKRWSVNFWNNDNDEIIGLESYKKDSEFVSEKIKTQIDPIPNIEIEFIREKDKYLLLVQVYSGNQTSYYYVGNGSRQAFVRIGNESVTAKNHELNKLNFKRM